MTVCDYWLFVDNSFNPFKVIAEGEKGKKVQVKDKEIWNFIRSNYYENR
jgi:hypothetical protein